MSRQRRTSWPTTVRRRGVLCWFKSSEQRAALGEFEDDRCRLYAQVSLSLMLKQHFQAKSTTNGKRFGLMGTHVECESTLYISSSFLSTFRRNIHFHSLPPVLFERPIYLPSLSLPHRAVLRLLHLLTGNSSRESRTVPAV